MKSIRLIDTTVRDGNQSNWGATGLDTGMMLFEGPILGASFFSPWKRCSALLAFGIWSGSVPARWCFPWSCLAGFGVGSTTLWPPVVACRLPRRPASPTTRRGLKRARITVLCVAARTPLDEAAALMFAQRCDVHGLSSRVEGPGALSTANIFRLETVGVASSVFLILIR
jgi:hypothetical protein